MQRAAEWGGHYQGGSGAGGNEAGRVGSTEVGRVGSTEMGRVGSTEVGRVGSTEALLLMIVLSLAPRPLRETGTIIQCE